MTVCCVFLRDVVNVRGCGEEGVGMNSTPILPSTATPRYYIINGHIITAGVGIPGVLGSPGT